MIRIARGTNLSDYSYTPVELDLFLKQVIKSKLAINIYKELLASGGDTAFGISDVLKAKGLRASKTRVYEEIAYLQKLGFIKRLSHRPPIYTTIHTPENLEKIAKRFFIKSREELMEKWAAVYPFLPQEQKQRNQEEMGDDQSVSLFKFNPFPIVDIFYNSPSGLKRLFYKVYESPEILICNFLVDTCMNGALFIKTISEDLPAFLNHLENTTGRYGKKIQMKTLTNTFSEELKTIWKLKGLPPIHKKILSYIDYELRVLEVPIMSFVLGEDTIFYPIGLGGIINKTSVLLEMKDEEIIDNARFTFETAWQKSQTAIKILDGKIIKERDLNFDS
ncbi:MAG: hypothetical protein K9W42_09960 [Candidatus Heimdallarchaeota archaeon]|nr:hypothetical protein [Candidatus Heimdallarchaeota archaeon]